MKIAVIGASGSVGKAVVELLEIEHEVIKLGSNHGDIKLDISNRKSIRTAFDKIGRVDAIINAAGTVAFKPFGEYTDEDWEVGLQSKLMGQIRLAEEGSNYLNDGGSITLTSGITADYPIRFGISAAVVGGAIEYFAKSAALEAPRGIRINVVSPTVLDESLAAYGDFFPGFLSIPGKEVAKFYKRSILGIENGHVFKCFAGNS
ncbi:short chain dehydrogenase [Pseudoalteromonas sp. NBT06-2]|uniref:short chain dehydrogenase n=1 Tax=Pseudoalteromonas sp. NBT06-2 TaxID=2025950 RepID=UPI000BA5E06A|nr:short chain dehydrogenase [Pseudoalteromonas sp. NBT06-2]PAJ73838.1 short chain dehydrogenase [Pseudoalteromonas sp. NBT06-2]